MDSSASVSEAGLHVQVYQLEFPESHGSRDHDSLLNITDRVDWQSWIKFFL